MPSKAAPESQQRDGRAVTGACSVRVASLVSGSKGCTLVG